MSLCNLFLSLTILQVNGILSFLNLISRVLVWALCLLSTCWALLRRVYSFYFGPSHILMCCSDAPNPDCLQAKKLQLSQDFLVCQVIHSLYHLCDFVELAPVCVHLSGTGVAKAGHSIPDVSHQAENERRISSLNLPTVLFPSNVSSCCHKRHIAGSCSTSCPLEQ